MGNESDNWKYIKELGHIHNQIGFGEKIQEDFDNYFEKNKENLKHMATIGIVVERATLTPKWIKSNPKFCNLARELLALFTDEEISDFGMRDAMRAFMLQELIQEEAE